MTIWSYLSIIGEAMPNSRKIKKNKKCMFSLSQLNPKKTQPIMKNILVKIKNELAPAYPSKFVKYCKPARVLLTYLVLPGT